MELTIKSLNIGAFDYISEVLGEHWFNECRDFYEDGVEVCDVSVNIEQVKIEVICGEEVYLSIGERICRLEREDFLEITIF